MDQASKGQDPTNNLHFERTSIKCGRCGRVFEHFIFEEIDDLVQLRCGDVLVPRTQMVCLHCGWVFHWDIREKDMAKMTEAYQVLVISINGYTPE
jgi:ribosomal protein L37E